MTDFCAKMPLWEASATLTRTGLVKYERTNGFMFYPLSLGMLVI